MAKEKIGAVTCDLKDLLFPVNVRKETMASNKEYSYKVVGKLKGKDFLCNQCSDIYELVPNSDIFPNIELILDANDIEYEVEYKHINHVRFYADYRITDSRFTYFMSGTNDVICPMLRVQHSYNGLTKYKIIFGYFRYVCENGVVIAVEEMKKFNLVIIGKHTEAIKKSLKQLDGMLKYFVAEANLIMNAVTMKYEILGGRSVTNLKDRLTEVLAATGMRAVDNNKFNTLADITRRIMKEANSVGLGYNGNVTDWLVYNGINQYINDDTRNIVVPEKRIETDSKVFEYMLENA